MQSITFLLLILLIVPNVLTQQLYYVKPNNLSIGSCPHRPCLTLDQYVKQTATYFTTRSTFIFLAGSHSLQTTVRLKNIFGITLKGADNDSNIIIICKNGVTISLSSVRSLDINGLTFVLHTSKTEQASSALSMLNSREIYISNSTFQGSADLNQNLARAIYCNNSDITITSCRFEGNTGDTGGAIYASGRNASIVFHNSYFCDNKAQMNGGAVYLSGGSVTVMDVKFSNNKALESGGAMHLSNSKLSLSGIENTFQGNQAKKGGGIYVITTRNSLVYSNVTSNTLHLNFQGNEAQELGGAIYAKFSSLTLGETLRHVHSFLNNSGEDGGAIYFLSDRSKLNLIRINGNSSFHDNKAFSFKPVSSFKSAGGALYIKFCIFFVSGTVLLSNNEAYYGGGLYLFGSDTSLAAIITFKNNSAEDGGGIFCVTASVLNSHSAQLNFVSNTARSRGGAYRISNFDPNNNMVISGSYINNQANICGGAVYIETGEKITFLNINVSGNSGSALCLSTGINITFFGTTTITNNTGRFGGGINTRRSFLYFRDHTTFDNNKASIGGGIYSLHGTLVFSGSTLFTHNTVDRDGGAIYALGTNITFKNQDLETCTNYCYKEATFEFNSAQNGAAVYFKNAATLDFHIYINFNTAHNHATQYGGAIYYEDITAPVQCELETNFHQDYSELTDLPYCFIQMSSLTSVRSLWSSILIKMNSYNDSAGINGSFLFGGLLDRCQLQIRNTSDDLQKSIIPYRVMKERIIKIQENGTNGITSLPYQLCFCENDQEYACSRVKHIDTQRGQKFTVSLRALDQLRSVTNTTVTAKISRTASLLLNQNSQMLPNVCKNVTYNLFSTEVHEQMILYPDGPCRDTGIASAVIDATLLPCPDAFVQSGQRCICEARLQEYDVDCIINEDIHITKNAGSKFWMNATYKNNSYEGLILYKTCPVDYCKNGTVNLTLDNPDIQCDLNHGGLLCGGCAANYSLMLGSFQCQVCSTAYITLLLPFAAAGIALVAFLSILRLTVASGMINSVILYANIVNSCRPIFFVTSNRNILTVFIAWMNLDLGIKTCFYDGMDAYAQTWLQFAFPIYVWILIILIIFTSRYSIIITKLIGHNPIAVLATLLLMSYAKILKIVIEVYSSVNLDYPRNRTVAVWLKDANVPYLQSKHLLLTVVISLVLIIFFLPYTLLLLVGYKLFRFSGRKYFHWLNMFKPLLDSYYAPYNKHTRYWTGFLLLVRCALYIVFSYNSLGATSKSLLAIIITFTAIVVIAWLSVKIYKRFFVNVIEATVYLNLITLSAVTLAGANSAALVYSLVGIVFVTMIGIMVYHFHILYVVKSAIWLKIKERLSSTFKKTSRPPLNTETVPCAPNNATSHDPRKIVSKTVIELREPLLEN